MMKYTWQAAKVLLCDSDELLHNTGTAQTKGLSCVCDVVGLLLINTRLSSSKKKQKGKSCGGTLISPCLLRGCFLSPLFFHENTISSSALALVPADQTKLGVGVCVCMCICVCMS